MLYQLSYTPKAGRLVSRSERRNQALIFHDGSVFEPKLRRFDELARAHKLGREGADTVVR